MGKNRQSPRRLKYRTCVINESGEVVHYEETTQFVTSGDGFIKIFDDSCLHGELRDVSYSAVMQIIRRMGFANAGQIVSLGPEVKKDIAASLRLGSDRQVERIVKKLVDCGVLRKLQRGVYQVNPFMFGKGKQEDIDALRADFMKTQRCGSEG